MSKRKPAKKLTEEQKQAQKAERTKRNYMRRSYQTPSTPEYRKFHTIWGSLSGGAVVFVIAALVYSLNGPKDPKILMTMLIPAVVCFAGSIVFDGVVGNKLRKQYEQDLKLKRNKKERRQLKSEAAKKAARKK